MNRMASLGALAGVLMVSACQGPSPTADLLLTGGRVYTLTWGEPDARGTPAPRLPHVYSPENMTQQAAAGQEEVLEHAYISSLMTCLLSLSLSVLYTLSTELWLDAKNCIDIVPKT